LHPTTRASCHSSFAPWISSHTEKGDRHPFIEPLEVLLQRLANRGDVFIIGRDRVPCHGAPQPFRSGTGSTLIKFR
jgi:hypothetical protein